MKIVQEVSPREVEINRSTEVLKLLSKPFNVKWPVTKKNQPTLKELSDKYVPLADLAG